MLDKSISIDGHNNIIVNNVKDSAITIVQSESKTKALKQVYDIFNDANNGIRENIDKLFNRHITCSWRTTKAIQGMHEKVETFHSTVEDNKFFYSHILYDVLSTFYEEANNTMDSLDMLTMTIASMNFKDMDEVYLYNYSNVREMMDAFYEKDDHCAYVDFADQYEKYDALTKKLEQLLDQECRQIV
jgi:hypothetical protein